MTYKRICTICGNEFETSNKQLLVCSDECKARRQVLASTAYRKKQRKAEREAELAKAKYCDFCGKEFHSARANMIYCSTYCRNRRFNTEKTSPYRTRKKKGKSLSELCREAREHGMDYGNYIVWLERNGYES